MDFIKDGMKNLQGLGFGAAVPGLRDQAFNAINNLTSSDEDQKKRIRAVLDEEEALKKSQMSARNGMKKGGKVKSKVSSASKRADGCCIKGKTKGRIV